MPDRPRNVGASVRQRPLNLAHARGRPMELLLTRYSLKRLLHRLGNSPDTRSRAAPPRDQVGKRTQGRCAPKYPISTALV
jgi:hypothetical protein